MQKEMVDCTPCGDRDQLDWDKYPVKREFEEPKECGTFLAKKNAKILSATTPRTPSQVLEAHSSKSQVVPFKENAVGPVISTTFTREGCQRVDIHGILVLKQDARIAELIYAKYGDISSDCQFVLPGLKTFLMDCVIDLVKLFRIRTARSLSEQDHELIQNNLHDLELSNFRVGWLRKRYNLALALTENAADISSHANLSMKITEVEALLANLKDEHDLVIKRMNERRDILYLRSVEVGIDTGLVKGLL